MSARLKPKRSKRYHRKHVHIPITGLSDDFGLVLHSALAAAELGHSARISTTASARLLTAFMVRWYCVRPKTRSADRD